MLGPLELVVDGSAVPLTAAKHRLLLAALLIRVPDAVPSDALVEALWNGRPPASARKALQVYASQLRALLPAGLRIETRGSGYALVLERAAVDARRFERSYAEGRAALAAGSAALARSLSTRALSLWRGPAYGELAYADFVKAEADRLDELRLAARILLLEAELELGERDVVGAARALVAEHPHDERVAGLAMRALYRAGRQADALDEYSAARQRLREGLGLEPGPALRELQHAILVHDRSLLPAIRTRLQPAQLPASPNVFVGRERELDELAELLHRREARFVVLTGAGGSGKSRLALEVSRAAAASFGDGAVQVQLAHVRDSTLVVPAILAALDVREDRGGDQWDTLVDALRDRELLLLLDNVEHVREAAVMFVELLRTAPLVTLLATSRTVLHLSGEHVYPVGPLAPDDAAELLRRRASEADARIRLHDDRLVHAICARVDGLPLALELVAVQLRTTAPEDLFERLDERLPLLTGGPRDLPARQQTLSATLEWSFDLLVDEERTAFTRLGVFAGGCTADAAEAVTGATPAVVGRLVDHSLLQRTNEEGASRFTMLETVRELALAKLDDERPAFESLHAEWACDLARHAELRGPGQYEWVARLRREEANLRAALLWSGTHRTKLQLALAGALWRYWWIRGLLAEGRRWLEAALEREVSAPELRAKALVGLAGLCWSQGDYASARDHALDAVAQAREERDGITEMGAQTVLGTVAKHEQRFAEARAHLQRSVALAVDHELEIDVLTGKLNLATVELDAGELDRAEPLLEEVLAAHRARGSFEGVGFALLNLGLVSYGRGEMARAGERFSAAHDAFDRVDFREHVANALHGLAAVAAADARYEDAARLLAKADPILREVGSEGFEPALVARTRTEVEAALGTDAFEAILRSAALNQAG